MSKGGFTDRVGSTQKIESAKGSKDPTGYVYQIEDEFNNDFSAADRLIMTAWMSNHARLVKQGCKARDGSDIFKACLVRDNGERLILQFFYNADTKERADILNREYQEDHQANMIKDLDNLHQDVRSKIVKPHKSYTHSGNADFNQGKIVFNTNEQVRTLDCL